MSVRIACDIDCDFDARAAGQRVSGVAVARSRTTIAFPKRIAKGAYRIRLVLSAPVNPGPRSCAHQSIAEDSLASGVRVPLSLGRAV